MTRIVLVTGSEFVRLSENDSSWSAQSALKDTQPQAIAIDPKDANRIYAASSHQGLWKSEDAGTSWQDLQLPASDVFSVAVSPVDGALYAGTEPSALFKSMDAGKTWQEMETLKKIPSAPSWSFPPRPHTSHVRWIAPSPHDKELLLVGIELGGVMRSIDAGLSWQDHRPGAKLDAHELAWHPQAIGRAYQAAGDGVAWSKDGGENWQSNSKGKSKRYTLALALDPHDPDLFFVSAAPSPMAAHYNRGAAQAAIYRWRADGPWEELSNLDKSLTSMPYTLQFHQGQLYTGFTDGEIWRSPDQGDSWQALPLGTAKPKRIIQMHITD
jgi:photosystem II stability/assembly factor-like uncharacterized protein